MEYILQHTACLLCVGVIASHDESWTAKVKTLAAHFFAQLLNVSFILDIYCKENVLIKAASVSLLVIRHQIAFEVHI